MREYFENDIKKLCILKKVLYVTLVVGITGISMFFMSLAGFGIKKSGLL